MGSFVYFFGSGRYAFEFDILQMAEELIEFGLEQVLDDSEEAADDVLLRVQGHERGVVYLNDHENAWQDIIDLVRFALA